MGDIRDHQLGIRFTEREHNILKCMSKNRGESLAEFIRRSLFSYIKQNQMKNVSIEFLQKKIKYMEKAIGFLSENLEEMKREIDLYEVKKIEKVLAEYHEENIINKNLEEQL